MERQSDGGEAREDEALDELLLLLVADEAHAVGEIFRERHLRAAAACTFDREGERWDAPWHRDDEGTALRLVLPDEVLSGHASGGGAEDLRRLAKALRSGAETPPPPCLPPEPVPAPSAAADPLVRRLEDAAAFLRAEAEAEPLLRRARVELLADRRCLEVLSSEWGHAGLRREAFRLHFSLELEDEALGRSSARRGCGWTGASPGRPFGGLVDELFAAARAGLGADRARPGSPPIVLAAGGGAVLFHEAVGHALEADVAMRAGTILSGRLGAEVAPSFVTVIDDPSLPELGGSARCDDEGVPGRALALIERGRVGQPLRDGLRCGFDRAGATGHGRRASHREGPLPRMTNTYLAPGEADPAELLRGIACGILVEGLERGSFDPATGAFRLRVSEAWRIEDGRRGRPLRPFWLEGDTSSLLAGIEELGGELSWDDGCGSCGRDGQWIPVAAGCPGVRLREGSLRVV